MSRIGREPVNTHKPSHFICADRCRWGRELPPVYSPADWSARTKAADEVKRLDDALARAVSSADYGPLAKIVGDKVAGQDGADA